MSFRRFSLCGGLLSLALAFVQRLRRSVKTDALAKEAKAAKPQNGRLCPRHHGSIRRPD